LQDSHLKAIQTPDLRLFESYPPAAIPIMAPITLWTFEQAQAYYNDAPDADVVVDIADDADELAALPAALGDLECATVDVWHSEYDGDDDPVRDYAGALERCGGRIGTLRLCALPVGGDFWRRLPAWCPALRHLQITDMDPCPEDLECLERCVRLESVGLNRSSATALHFSALARGSVESVCLIDNELLMEEDVRAIEALDTPVRCILDDGLLACSVPRHRRAGAPAFGLSASDAARLGLYAGFAAGQ